MTRRRLLIWASRLLLITGFLGRSRRALAEPSWTVSPATAGDAAELAAVFNSHIQEGKCPYPERAQAWTTERAQGFLEGYDATLVIRHDGIPVGFAGVVDYTTEKGRRSIAPGAVPVISVFAIAAARLEPGEELMAAKRLAAGVGRKLNTMGFDKCEMLIKADPIFSSDTWFRSEMAIESIERRNGSVHALRVQFNVTAIASGLAAEGL